MKRGIVVSLLFMGPFLSFSQETQIPLQHEVEVVLKLVKVYVVDQYDMPVLDLNQEDFRLYVNNKEVDIVAFEKHFSSLKTKKLDAAIRPHQIIPQVRDEGRNFIFFFDYFMNDIKGIKDSKKMALDFINNQIKPNDKITILFFSASKGLMLVEYQSTNRERNIISIKNIKEIPELSSGIGASGLVITRNYINDMDDFAKAIRLIPGFKYLLFFSAGLREKYKHDRFSEYAKACRKLAEAGVTAFCIDSIGLRIPDTDLGSRRINNQVSLKNTSINYSMIDLARITGGQYYSSMINHEVINDDIGAFIDHYYVLGFYLKEKLDGRFQSLKANVKRKKCRVIFQKGFYNPKPYEKLSDFEKKLHLNDLAFNEIFVYQDPIPLNMTAFPFEKDGKQFLMVMTEIPENRPKSLFDNKSELFVFLSAGNNTVTQVNLGRVDLADLLGTNTYFYIVLPLPPEEYQCRSVIRNTVTGEAAVASAITTIPDQGDLGMTVSDTLLFFADRECRVVQFHTDKKEKIATDEKERLNTVPILTDVIPFLPQNFKLIDEELNSSENEFCAFLKIRYPINEKPVFHLNLELQNDSSGVLLPIDYQLKQTVKKNNVYDVLIEVVIPSVKPGPYSLIFNIKEEKSGKQIKISRTIKINEGIR